MKRRDFIALAGATATAAALPRFAFGQAAKVPRMVILSSFASTNTQPKTILTSLADLGWVDGKNISVDILYIPSFDEAPAYAAQAVASKPDVIVALGRPAAPAAKAATSTIPIVFTNVSVDPASIGLVSSLAHPGGNATGNFSPDTTGKQLEYLKKILPDLKRFVYLHVPEEDTTGAFLAPVQAGARALDLEALVIDFVVGPDLTTQFDRIVATGVKALFIGPSAYCVSNGQLLFDLELKNKIVSAGYSGSLVPQGLFSKGTTGNTLMYGVDIGAEIRRSATFVDAILKGAKPADLPVEIPTAYNLILYLDTAKKLGLTIPPAVLIEAAQVIDYDPVEHR